MATSVGVLAMPAAACACGAFLLPEVETVDVASEHAIISWDGSEERILLTMDVNSSSPDAALLIPTPSPATVTVADAGAFTELARYTAPRVERVDLWWPEWLTRTDLSHERVDDAAPVPQAAPLGDISAEVIESADADGLQEWLQRHELELRDRVASALVPYIQQGWYFTLINLDTESLKGRLQPLDIRFETNQVVYPMRLSVAGGPLDVETYVFSEHRMERTDSMGGALRFAGPVSQTDFSNQTLVDLARAHPFMTVWRQSFTDPRTQIDSDMVFAAASTDATFHETELEVIRHEIFGMPAGPILAFAGFFALGAFGATVSIMQRRKRRRRYSR